MLRQEPDKTSLSHRGAVAHHPGRKDSGQFFNGYYVKPLHELYDMLHLLRFFFTGALVTACLRTLSKQADATGQTPIIVGPQGLCNK